MGRCCCFVKALLPVGDASCDVGCRNVKTVCSVLRHAVLCVCVCADVQQATKATGSFKVAAAALPGLVGGMSPQRCSPVS